MRKILFYNKNYSSDFDNYSNCNINSNLIEGSQNFCHDISKNCNGFKSSYFENLFLLESKSFWFIGRNNLIINMLKKYRPHFESFFEIGCGTGFVLSGVSVVFKTAKFFGSEIFIEGLNFASKRTPHAHFMQMDARTIPFKEEFEVIAAFDVLEHIEEDERVLNEISKALKPDGLLLITVPQHKWLWSHSDDYACHVRRYNKKDLHSKIEINGFKIIKSTSFVSLLLPMMLISRFLQKSKEYSKYNPNEELNLPKFLNKFLLMVMLIEIYIIKIGFDFPIGGSRLVVAKKELQKDKL